MENIGFGLYPFVSQDADKYADLIEQYLEFPVIITDLDHLEECIELIEKGVKEISKDEKETLTKLPHNLKGAIINETFDE